MGAIQTLDSKAIQTTKELPNGEYFKLEFLEGWNQMSEDQQAYLTTYFDTYPRKIRACVEAKVSQSTYQGWLSNKQFTTLMELIERIHTEELEGLDYDEAYTDSKVRGRFLKNKKEKKSSPKVTVNNFKATTASDIMKNVEEVVGED